jgi:hypothetical protein
LFDRQSSTLQIIERASIFLSKARRPDKLVTTAGIQREQADRFTVRFLSASPFVFCPLRLSFPSVSQSFPTSFVKLSLSDTRVPLHSIEESPFCPSFPTILQLFSSVLQLFSTSFAKLLLSDSWVSLHSVKESQSWLPLEASNSFSLKDQPTSLPSSKETENKVSF